MHRGPSGDLGPHGIHLEGGRRGIGTRHAGHEGKPEPLNLTCAATPEALGQSPGQRTKRAAVPHRVLVLAQASRRPRAPPHSRGSRLEALPPYLTPTFTEKLWPELSLKKCLGVAMAESIIGPTKGSMIWFGCVPTLISS